MSSIIKVKDASQVSAWVANIIAGQVTLKYNSILGLATGSTPIGAYKELINKCKNKEVDFSFVSAVNLDEYVGLEPNHEQSYSRFMKENLFNHININQSKCFIPNGNAQDINAECNRYEAIIEQIGPVDLQLLGIGNNGHIAFNEPSDSFSPRTNFVELTKSTIEANQRFFTKPNEKVPTHALTMGIGTIIKAKTIVLAATGAAKAQAISKALTGPVNPQMPASILQLHPNVIVVVDLEAGKFLN